MEILAAFDVGVNNDNLHNLKLKTNSDIIIKHITKFSTRGDDFGQDLVR